MKKLFSLILTLLLLAGCYSVPKYNNKVTLYYPASDASRQLITELPCEGSGKNAEEILSEYFSRQDDPSIFHFPAGVAVSSLKLKESHATLLLTDQFAELTGIQLTKACICITKTVAGLTGVSTVTIGCQSELIDGEQSITFSESSILWVDEGMSSAPSSQSTTPTNQEDHT